MDQSTNPRHEFKILVRNDGTIEAETPEGIISAALERDRLTALEQYWNNEGQGPTNAFLEGLDVIGFGWALYEALLLNEIGQWMEGRLEKLTEHDPLHVRLAFEDPYSAGASLPWELLYHSSLDLWLAADDRLTFTRFVDTYGTAPEAITEGPFLTLYVLAYPFEMPPPESVISPIYNDFILGKPDERFPVTPDGLLDGIENTDATILHFTGHSRSGEGQTEIALQTETGEALWIPVRDWAEHGLGAARRSPALAVFDLTGPAPGLGPALAQAGLPAVLVKQLPLPADRFLTFSRVFYDALTEEIPVDVAAQRGRRTLLGRRPNWDFAAPALYARVGEVRFERPVSPERSALTKNRLKGGQRLKGASFKANLAFEQEPPQVVTAHRDTPLPLRLTNTGEAPLDPDRVGLACRMVREHPTEEEGEQVVSLLLPSAVEPGGSWAIPFAAPGFPVEDTFRFSWHLGPVVDLEEDVRIEIDEESEPLLEAMFEYVDVQALLASLSAFSSEDVDARRATAETLRRVALGSTDGERVREVTERGLVGTLLEDEDAEVRRTSVTTLYRLHGTNQPLDALIEEAFRERPHLLIEALNDRHRDVRRDTIRMIQATGLDTPDVRQALEERRSIETSKRVLEAFEAPGLEDAGAETPEADSDERPLLKFGDGSPDTAERREATRRLQETLNRHAFGLPVDGVFGPATNRAVRRFQEYNGLAPDGIVGPGTWERLDTLPPSNIGELVGERDASPVQPVANRSEAEMPEDDVDDLHVYDLVEQLRTGDLISVTEAAERLERLGPEAAQAAPALAEVLRSGARDSFEKGGFPAQARAGLIRTLGSIGSPSDDTRDLLFDVLDNPAETNSVRQAAARALGRIYGVDSGLLEPALLELNTAASMLRRAIGRPALKENNGRSSQAPVEVEEERPRSNQSGTGGLGSPWSVSLRLLEPVPEVLVPSDPPELVLELTNTGEVSLDPNEVLMICEREVSAQPDRTPSSAFYTIRLYEPLEPGASHTFGYRPKLDDITADGRCRLIWYLDGLGTRLPGTALSGREMRLLVQEFELIDPAALLKAWPGISAPFEERMAWFEKVQRAVQGGIPSHLRLELVQDGLINKGLYDSFTDIQQAALKSLYGVYGSDAQDEELDRVIEEAFEANAVPLVNGLLDQDWYLRRETARFIARLAGEGKPVPADVGEALRDQLNEERVPSVRSQIEEALAQIGRAQPEETEEAEGGQQAILDSEETPSETSLVEKEPGPAGVVPPEAADLPTPVSLGRVEQQVAEGDLAEAERLAAAVVGADRRALALVRIAQASSDPAQKRRLLNEARRLADTLEEGDRKAATLIEIARQIDASAEKRRVLDSARLAAATVDDDSRRNEALARLAEIVAETNPLEARRIAGSIQDLGLLPTVLFRLVEIVAETDPVEAERIAASIDAPYSKAEALARLAETVAETNLAEAERIAGTIEDDYQQARALIKIAQATEDPVDKRRVLEEAERVAVPIQDYNQRAEVLAQVAQMVAETDPSAAEGIVSNIGANSYRAETLIKIAQALQDPVEKRRVLSEAQSVTVSLRDDNQRAETLARIVSLVAERDPREAEGIAATIQDEYHRADALTAIARAVDDTVEKRRVLDQAEGVAAGIKDAYQRAEAHVKIARDAVDPPEKGRLLDKAERIAADIEAADWHAELLTRISRFTQDAVERRRLLDEAERIASGIEEESWQAGTLATIARARDEESERRRLLDEARRIAFGIEDDHWRAETLARIEETVAEPDPLEEAFENPDGLPYGGTPSPNIEFNPYDLLAADEQQNTDEDLESVSSNGTSAQPILEDEEQAAKPARQGAAGLQESTPEAVLNQIVADDQRVTLAPVFNTFWSNTVRAVQRPEDTFAGQTLDVHLRVSPGAAFRQQVGEVEGEEKPAPSYTVVLALKKRENGVLQPVQYFEGALHVDAFVVGRVEDEYRYGRTLHEALFHDEVPENAELLDAQEPGRAPLKDGYVQGVREATNDEPLRVQIRIDTQAVVLHRFKWEYLYDATGRVREPLACSPLTPLARVLQVNTGGDFQPRLIDAGHPLRILAVLASPGELSPDWAGPRNALFGKLPPIEQAELDVLVKGVEEASLVRSLRDVDLLSSHDRQTVSLTAIADRLQQAVDEGHPFHVLHLLGHGLIGPDGQGYLVLDAEDGTRAVMVSERKVSEFLRPFVAGGLHLVVLASCFTAQPAEDHALQGIARRLVADGFPAVVAMQEAFQYEAAQHFAQRLYRQLTYHGEIDRAVNAARRELWLRREPEVVARVRSAVDRTVAADQWGIPVLFMRVPDGRLFVVDAAAQQQADPEAQTVATPYADTPGADPKRLVRAMMQQVAGQMGLPFDVGAFAQAIGQAMGRITMAREPEEPQPLPDLTRDTIFAPVRLRRQDVAVEHNLVLQDDVVPQAIAALNAQKHVILIGPPGTGKTTLAQAFCTSARKVGSNDGFYMVTATADWTTFDTIGGYVPESGDRLVFRPGVFLDAIQENKWLIIDEINRADIDKAFGELFTVLSGQAVTLPYKIAGRNVRIVPPGTEPSARTVDYVVDPSWRIIGTMNVYDKASLFAMSYAFMRRFAFVDVDLPPHPAYQRLIREALAKQVPPPEPADVEAEDLLKEVRELLYALFTPDRTTQESVRFRAIRPMGPAIALDTIRYLSSREPAAGSGPGLTKHLIEAVLLYVAPQLDGLQQHQILSVYRDLEAMFNRDVAYKALLKRIEGLYPYIHDWTPES